MRQRGRLVHADIPAFTSSRKWERDGWLSRSIENMVLTLLFFGGVSPVTLAKRYYRHVGPS
jgi:hypothetical protein